MHKDRARCDREIWIENTKRFHPLAREFFTPQEDDLNFLLENFFFLDDVNNSESVSAVALANLGANELLIISVRCNDKCSLSKTDRQLLKVIQTY